MAGEQEQLEVRRFRENLLKNKEVFSKVRPMLVSRALRPQQKIDPFDSLFKAIFQTIPRWMLNLESKYED